MATFRWSVGGDPGNSTVLKRRDWPVGSLVVLETHPVQYRAPIYRTLRQRFGIPVTVVYGSDFSVVGYRDSEFQAEFSMGYGPSIGIRIGVPVSGDGSRGPFRGRSFHSWFKRGPSQAGSRGCADGRLWPAVPSGCLLASLRAKGCLSFSGERPPITLGSGDAF